MNKNRKYTVLIGSKRFFDEQLNQLLPNLKVSDSNSFPQMVRKHDEFSKRVIISTDEKQKNIPFDRTDLLIIKNSDYHSIVSTAHDRLSSLIEELTTDNAEVFIHNPTKNLKDYLNIQNSQNKIIFEEFIEEYEIERDSIFFNKKIQEISQVIVGQEKAIFEIGKSMWYLTRVRRIKPFVIMLYGNSSIGKTEIVREISSNFFNNKVFEKHLSMFKNERSQYYLFGDDPNRASIGFDLLERESNLIFLDEFDKLPDFFHSVFYTLFDNVMFSDSTYQVDISGLLIFLTSNYSNLEEMKEHLGLPIFYRIDKFIQFEDFSTDTIRTIAKREIDTHSNEVLGDINKDILFRRVSQKTKSNGENARTVKNIVQQEVENLLYEEVINQ